MSTLEGYYYEYASNGALYRSGYYTNNEKDKDWFNYNDTGKIIVEEKYEMGVLVKTINPDTVKKNLPTKDEAKKYEIEATYKKGEKDLIKYLNEKLHPDVVLQSVTGGQVKVLFKINTEGKCVDVHMKKSIEFVLDEEVIRVIENAPLWQPARQDGKIVNGYRMQPITFSKP